MMIKYVLEEEYFKRQSMLIPLFRNGQSIAEVLYRYGDEFYIDYAAVTRKSQGKALYITSDAARAKIRLPAYRGCPPCQK